MPSIERPNEGLEPHDVELARVLLRIRQSEAIPAALATFRP